MILAFDTSGPHCTVALAAQDGNFVAARSEDIGREHAERLMGFVDDVLNEGGVGFPSLSTIGCTTGPGSFTGLRVGLATAQGLSLALGKPGAGVSVFEVLAQACVAAKVAYPFCIVQDARREQVYLQPFDATGRPMAEPAVFALEAIAEAIPVGVTHVAGTGATLAAQHVDGLKVLDVAPHPTPEHLAAACAAASSHAGLSPLYLRSADAKPQRAVAQL